MLVVFLAVSSVYRLIVGKRVGRASVLFFLRLRQIPLQSPPARLGLTYFIIHRTFPNACSSAAVTFKVQVNPALSASSFRNNHLVFFFLSLFYLAFFLFRSRYPLALTSFSLVPEKRLRSDPADHVLATYTQLDARQHPARSHQAWPKPRP